ncbi:MAG: hypothetical protein ACREV9_17240 [Burkholderiales bacterium]
MIARLVFLLCFCPFAYADELSICYNYGCAATTKIALSAPELVRVNALFRETPDAASERVKLGEAIALMQSFAARKTPTRNDRPGNYADDIVDGRMDCIDHSKNSTTYLNFLQSAGLLKHHRVLPPVMRAPWIVNVHWAARIVDAEGREFAVDSWSSERDTPVPIVPLQAWLKGRNV